MCDVRITTDKRELSGIICPPADSPARTTPGFPHARRPRHGFPPRADRAVWHPRAAGGRGRAAAQAGGETFPRVALARTARAMLSHQWSPDPPLSQLCALFVARLRARGDSAITEGYGHPHIPRSHH
jgi:hypothetical protein